MTQKKTLCLVMLFFFAFSGIAFSGQTKKSLKKKKKCASGILCQINNHSADTKKLLVRFNGVSHKIMEKGIAASKDNPGASEKIWEIRELLENVQDQTHVLNSFMSMALWISKEHVCDYASFLIMRYRIYEKAYGAYMEMISRTVSSLHDPGALALIREAREELSRCKGEMDTAYQALASHKEKACP